MTDINKLSTLFQSLVEVAVKNEIDSRQLGKENLIPNIVSNTINPSIYFSSKFDDSKWESLFNNETKYHNRNLVSKNGFRMLNDISHQYLIQFNILSYLNEYQLLNKGRICKIEAYEETDLIYITSVSVDKKLMPVYFNNIIQKNDCKSEASDEIVVGSTNFYLKYN
jgi:hypothetical protein